MQASGTAADAFTRAVLNPYREKKDEKLSSVQAGSAKLGEM